MARTFSQDARGRWHDGKTGRLVSGATVERSARAARAHAERVAAETREAVARSDAARRGWETRRANLEAERALRQAARPPARDTGLWRPVPVPPSELPVAQIIPPSIDRLIRESRRPDLRDAYFQPVELLGTYTRVRDRDTGRWVSKDAYARMTALEREGVKLVRMYKTHEGLEGPRMLPLVRALREFERRGMSWAEVPDEYFRRAVALSLV